MIDSVTGQVLGTGSSANTQTGLLGDRRHSRRTPTDPVKLQVVVTPPSGVTTSVDLDAATLNVSYDYGIIASGAWAVTCRAPVPAILNLPATVHNTYNSNRVKMLSEANFTVENGSIVQGQGSGADSSPLFFEMSVDLPVNNIQLLTRASIPQTWMLYAASGEMTVINSTFQDNIPNVTNRM